MTKSTKREGEFSQTLQTLQPLNPKLDLEVLLGKHGKLLQHNMNLYSKFQELERLPEIIVNLDLSCGLGESRFLQGGLANCRAPAYYSVYSLSVPGLWPDKVSLHQDVS